MKKKRYHKELRKQGIKNFKRVLMLKCLVCGKYENKTLMLHSEEPRYFVGAETAAYLNCMRWVRNRKGKQRIEVGDIRYAKVYFPICCKIGDEFVVAENEFEEFEEMMHTGGDFIIWVYIAGGAAALALIVGIIILVTGKKK